MGSCRVFLPRRWMYKEAFGRTISRMGNYFLLTYCFELDSWWHTSECDNDGDTRLRYTWRKHYHSIYHHVDSLPSKPLSRKDLKRILTRQEYNLSADTSLNTHTKTENSWVESTRCSENEGGKTKLLDIRNFHSQLHFNDEINMVGKARRKK